MKKTKFLLELTLVLACFLLAPLAMAETVISFKAKATINADASINVIEVINYDFEGALKHGIYRDIPYKYKTDLGNYRIKITNIRVTDQDGRPYKFEVLTEGKNKRIKIGDPDNYITGAKIYRISYEVKRAISYYQDFDELYWNVTGQDWEVPILESSAQVSLAMPEASFLQAACYGGLYGYNSACSQRNLSADNKSVSFFQEDPLAGSPGLGLTFAVSFPKGLVYQPSQAEQIMLMLFDNLIFGLPVLTFIFLLIFWWINGRDPAGKKTIIAEYEVIDNLSPAQVGAIMDFSVQNKEISAEIVSLAIKGYIKIHHQPDRGILDKFSKADNYFLQRLNPDYSSLNSVEKEVMSHLFKSLYNQTHVVNEITIEAVKLADLKQKFYKDLKIIKNKVYENLTADKYFAHNPDKYRALMLSMGISSLVGMLYFIEYLGVISMVCIGISLVWLIIFSFFIPRRTLKGVLAKEHLLGLKLYLSVAEKDRIAFHNAPEKNPETFEKFLPYAMVLGVEKQWSKQFEEIYQTQPNWYSDPTMTHFNALILSQHLGGFSKTASGMIAAKPSSSGSGGGGFSGGGFGGGGGGSW